MSSDLRPCPFCGGEAELSESDMVFGIYKVYCSNGCGGEVGHGNDEYGMSKNDAINQWNNRPQLDEVVRFDG